MYLAGKPEAELTAREKIIRAQIVEQKIEYFPIGKALSLEQADDEDAIDDKVSILYYSLLSW